MNDLFGLIAAVVLVFVLLLLRKSIGLVMLAGSLVLALFMRVSFLEGIHIVKDALVSPATVDFLLAVTGIGILGELMFHTGALEKALEALKAMVRDSRLLIMLLPAIIGLLPIPGGAYFSAPMVAQVGTGLKMDPARKALANIFFRHFVMSIYPLFPGFIAMISLSEISAGSLAVLSLPPVAVTVLVGTWFIFNKSGRGSLEEGRRPQIFESIKSFTYGLLPVILAVIALVALGWPTWAALLLALVVAMLQYLSGDSWLPELRKRLILLFRKIPVTIILGVAGSMIFKEFIANSEALECLSVLFKNAGAPPVLLILIFPYLAGIFTGNCYASLALTLPVLSPLLGVTGNSIAMLALAYQGSVWGYITSPVHLCQLLTIEYYKVPLTAVMPHLAWIGALVLAFSTFFFALI
jgi:integral membrane protein (TIGR00529 family)